jgi:hypothetical protein
MPHFNAVFSTRKQADDSNLLLTRFLSADCEYYTREDIVDFLKQGIIVTSCVFENKTKLRCERVYLSHEGLLRISTAASAGIDDIGTLHVLESLLAQIAICEQTQPAGDASPTNASILLAKVKTQDNHSIDARLFIKFLSNITHKCHFALDTIFLFWYEIFFTCYKIFDLRDDKFQILKHDVCNFL